MLELRRVQLAANRKGMQPRRTDDVYDDECNQVKHAASPPQHIRSLITEYERIRAWFLNPYLTERGSTTAAESKKNSEMISTPLRWWILFSGGRISRRTLFFHSTRWAKRDTRRRICADAEDTCSAIMNKHIVIRCWFWDALIVYCVLRRTPSVCDVELPGGYFITIYLLRHFSC